MEMETIYEIFCRSLPKYNVRYVSYFGDDDAKVHSYLTSHPPYPGVVVQKIEDSNHFAKRTLNRRKKLNKRTRIYFYRMTKIQ